MWKKWLLENLENLSGEISDLLAELSNKLEDFSHLNVFKGIVHQFEIYNIVIVSQRKKHFLKKGHLDKTFLTRNNWDKWCSKSVRVAFDWVIASVLIHNKCHSKSASSEAPDNVGRWLYKIERQRSAYLWRCRQLFRSTSSNIHYLLHSSSHFYGTRWLTSIMRKLR